MLSLVFLTYSVAVLQLGNCADIGHTVSSPHKRINDTRKLTNALHCGNRSSLIGTRIIGGGPSELGEWPWMAALYFTAGKTGKKKSTANNECGGSLISDEWILTAAHCLPESYEDSKLSFARLGDLDLRDTVNDGAKPADVPVKRIIQHPDYDAATSENDIGLVHLSKKVKFTENIYPICLLSGKEYLSDAYYNGKLGTIAGWGITQTKSPTKVLKHTDVKLGDCLKNVELEKAGQAKLDYRVFCGGDTKHDSCQGDSGGPLMLENRTNGAYYQAGIVSFGLGCARKDYPGVYTKVPAFIDWINEQTRLKF